MCYWKNSLGYSGTPGKSLAWFLLMNWPNACIGCSYYVECLSLCCFIVESLVKHLSYEIVTPIRVNEFGETFPHTQHFKRRKRTTETVLMPIPYRTHYRVSAYGQVFQLNLSADASFVAPHYTEVHMGATKEDLHSDLLHCFYRGHVNAQEIHTAVFSICGGLVSSTMFIVLVVFLHSCSFWL